MSTPLLELFQVVRGSNQSFRFAFLDQYGDAENVPNDATGNAVIKDKPGGATIFTIALTIEPDGLVGVVEFDLTSVQTAAMTAQLYVVRAELSFGGEAHFSTYLNMKVSG